MSKKLSVRDAKRILRTAMVLGGNFKYTSVGRLESLTNNDGITTYSRDIHVQTPEGVRKFRVYSDHTAYRLI